MRLYLVQHGISASPEEGGEKVLTEKGREETKLIASVAAHYSVSPAGIVHSGKIRARQTAEIYQEALQPEQHLQEISGIQPLDDVVGFADNINSLEDHMIVGHLPFMDRLLSYLTSGNQEAKIFKFQNSGIVCLSIEKGEDGGLNSQILWMLNPNVS